MFSQLLTETPTTAPSDTDLPELPEGVTIPDTADDAGKLCMIRAVFSRPTTATGSEPEATCGHWASATLLGMCGVCWVPVATLACEPCTDLTVRMSAQDPAHPDFPLRTRCCGGGPFLLMHVSPL